MNLEIAGIDINLMFDDFRRIGQGSGTQSSLVLTVGQNRAPESPGIDHVH